MLVAFDLEIAQPIPTHCPECDGTNVQTTVDDERMCMDCSYMAKAWGFVTDPWRYAPLGISCAAAAYRGGDEDVSLTTFRFWQSDHDEEAMSIDQVREMLRDLWILQAGGGEIVTWNGAHFDFKVIAEESGHHETVATMLDHIDPMFELFCRRGHTLGLDKASKGMGVEGKLKSVTLNDGTEFTEMSGMAAPQMWLDGERDAVLAYLQEDVRSLLELAGAIERNKVLRWTSSTGRPMSVPMGLLTVRESLALPEPDTSWMGPGRKTRQDLIGWIGKKWLQ